MRAEESEKVLREQLREAGLTLKSLGARDVLRIATDFWRTAEFDGLREDAGDGLVAYFDLLARKGTVFEFGIHRLLRPARDPDAPYEAWLPSWTLRFCIQYTPTLETFQLKPVTTVLACWRKQDAASFAEAVASTPQFLHCEALTPKSCAIKLYESRSPWGEPDHPTQGYAWAMA